VSEAFEVFRKEAVKRKAMVKNKVMPIFLQAGVTLLPHFDRLEIA